MNPKSKSDTQEGKVRESDVRELSLQSSYVSLYQSVCLLPSLQKISEGNVRSTSKVGQGGSLGLRSDHSCVVSNRERDWCLEHPVRQWNGYILFTAKCVRSYRNQSVCSLVGSQWTKMAAICESIMVWKIQSDCRITTSGFDTNDPIIVNQPTTIIIIVIVALTSQFRTQIGLYLKSKTWFIHGINSL
jgi:hypothetical protein